MAENLENLRLEYQTLVEGMKSVFDSYYKLATMTFTWNASLGAAIAFLGKDEFTSEAKFIAAGLSFLAIFYNFSALLSYNSTVRVFNTLREQTLELIKSRDDFKISKSLLAGERDHNWRVETFISGVLVIMVALWIGIMCWVVL